MELKKQMEDVRDAVSQLNICLNLLLHDKEQFIKEFGEAAYIRFYNTHKRLIAWDAKEYNDKTWFF